MRKIYAPITVTIIVSVFAGLYHWLRVIPNNWALFFSWLPLFIAPIWIIVGIEWLTERGKAE